MAAVVLLVSLVAAWALPAQDATWLLLLHAILPVVAGLMVLPRVGKALQGAPREGLLWGAVGTAGLCALAGGAAWLPLPSAARDVAVWLHAAAGTAAGMLVLARLAVRASARRTRVAGLGLAALLLAPLGVYGVGEAARQRHGVSASPRYDAEACFRFLTATATEDSGAPLFPSALRIDRSTGSATADCTRSGCHGGYAAGHAHAAVGTSPAYRTTLSDFTARRGGEAARWCRGCHAPETLRGTGTLSASGEGESFSCLTCHGAREVHAGYGSAALALGAAPDLRRAAGWLPASPLLRRKHHAETMLRPGVPDSAEFCGACHRKNWSLPQNEYRWLPGPDEYRNWRESAFSGMTPYAAGPAAPVKTCTGCHDPHTTASSAGEKAARAPLRFMALDAFLRRESPTTIAPVDRSLAPRPGETALLDVVVRNTGIGHDFPTGMPDLQESWLEVRVSDPKGHMVLTSGVPSPGALRDDRAHYYRLAALDRNGRIVTHGDLDRMVAVAEWRRIPAGEADLARYRLTVPASGLGEISVRLLRRRRPEFARWAGEKPGPPEVLAETRLTPLGPGDPSPPEEGGDYLARRWRDYGAALTRVRAYPQAIQALNRALARNPADVETLLALGRVFLEEGDLLAAREQFRRIAAPEDARASAWDASIERKMGQPESAARMLTPLVRRFPRDSQLRFELGKSLMDQLRNEEAAREFEGMLDIDPLDQTAHFNLMLCRQRLNQLSVARREEVIYRLLYDEDASPLSPAPGQPRYGEDEPLHVHPLEPRP